MSVAETMSTEGAGTAGSSVAMKNLSADATPSQKRRSSALDRDGGFTFVDTLEDCRCCYPRVSAT